MREKAADDAAPDIPFWFITYSDVITLLMTFFILLLTFATSEPEKFERMQIAVFGGGGSSGIAGESSDPMEKDSMLARQRPRMSRLTTRGSEMPSMDEDPSMESFGDGLEGLDERLTKTPSESYQMRIPVSLVITDRRQVTPQGQQILRMIARQLRKDPYRLRIQVPDPRNLSRAIALGQHLADELGIPAGKIGVGLANKSESKRSSLSLTLSRQSKE